MLCYLYIFPALHKRLCSRSEGACVESICLQRFILVKLDKIAHLAVESGMSTDGKEHGNITGILHTVSNIQFLFLNGKADIQLKVKRVNALCIRA